MPDAVGAPNTRTQVTTPSLPNHRGRPITNALKRRLTAICCRHQSHSLHPAEGQAGPPPLPSGTLLRCTHRHSAAAPPRCSSPIPLPPAFARRCVPDDRTRTPTASSASANPTPRRRPNTLPPSPPRGVRERTPLTCKVAWPLAARRTASFAWALGLFAIPNFAYYTRLARTRRCTCALHTKFGPLVGAHASPAPNGPVPPPLDGQAPAGARNVTGGLCSP